MYLNGEKCNFRERIVEMMYVKILEIVKEIVFKLMVSYDGYVRVFICIIVFGMGVDVKGVCIIIYFGLLCNLESYV